MTVSTEGLQINAGSRFVRACVELLSSMRFSISLLSIICIASVIGTVLQQQMPYGNYVNQFGPFWAEVFGALKLYAVYSSWWFLLILAFLVTSTSLCIARNAPKIFADLRTYKENMREQSLRAFKHRVDANFDNSPEVAAHAMGKTMVKAGWKVKLQQRDSGWMLAAKAGAANKIGYIFAHSAIVLVCIGGLLDGDLVVRAQMLFNGKTPYTGGGFIADVKPEHRLGENNPTFRGNLLVSEGAQASTAILNQSDGILLQDLPFSIELTKFIVEYYSTGMPKLFASEILIHDKATGEVHPARVEVNHPASFKGVEIYQSSFDDGGSSVTLQAVPLNGSNHSFEVKGTIGTSTDLSTDKQKLTLEFAALRVINVENFANDASNGGPIDVRKVDLRSSIDARLGAANKTVTQKVLRNVGPSITYRLRDQAGQAREFHNYMNPIDTGDGVPVFLLGMRDTPADQFRYLRVPVDAEGEMNDFLRMRNALLDPAMRTRAVNRYAAKAVDASRPEVVRQLAESASKALALFAGVEGAKSANGAAPVGGLQGVSDFLESNVPEAERGRASEVLVRILNGALFELLQVTREDAKLKPLDASDKTQAFMTQAVLSLSDVQIYPAPVAFELTEFKQVQASVFQVARAPGKTIVYLGCAFLILGIFAMLYVRERRVWAWFTPGENGGSKATLALSSNRQSMDTDREFAHLSAALMGAQRSGDMK